MIKTKEEMEKIAQTQIPKSERKMKLLRVGNIQECWIDSENQLFYQQERRLCIWRVDEAEFLDGDGDMPKWSKRKDNEIFTKENGDYWYAVADFECSEDNNKKI